MTDWEAHYRSGEAPWDKGAPAPPLIDWLSKNEIQGHWLVPGCGRGHDVGALAGAGVEEVIGIDIAETAISEASQYLHQFDNARALHQDLFVLSATYPEYFDGVFEHTCYCAIPRGRRDDYVKAMHELLKPGGVLLAVFYINPRDNPDPELGPPFNASLEELDSRFGPYFTLEQDEVPAIAYPGREARERLRLYRKRAVH